MATKYGNARPDPETLNLAENHSMTERTCIPIHEGIDGSLQFDDETGASHKFLQHTRQIYFTVNSLTVSELFGRGWSNGDSDAQPAQVASRQFVRGFATLGDKGISVIGNPNNWTRRLAISIGERTAEGHAKKVVQASEETAENCGLNLSDANLAYIEYGVKDAHWSIGIQVSGRTLDILADAVQNNRVHSLRIGMSLNRVYNDGDLGSLYSDEPVNLYLRPSIRSGDVQLPELAYGHLDIWELKFIGTAVLSDPFAQELPPTSNMHHVEESHGPSDVDKVLSALEQLTSGVGTLRSSIVRVGWILAAALTISTLLR